MTTTSRLLLLLSLLQSRRDWPGQLLATRLGISHRTVRRDVDRLREMGYRIGSVKGPDGGYRLDAGTELPPLLFDDDQVIALAVALRAAATTGLGIGVGEAAIRALTTVRQVMPARLRHRLDALEFTALPPGRGAARGGESVPPEVLIALSGAVRAKEVLRFDYARAAGVGAGGATADPAAGATPTPPPPRRVEPHHIVTSQGRWYLVAWDLDADDWRTFRADRITPRTPTGPRFGPRNLPGGVDVHQFVAARFTGSPGADTWPCVGTVILQLPLADVLPYAADGTADEVTPGRTRLTAGSWSWVALAASFGRFDAALEVEGPPELAAAFYTLARRFSAGRAASPHGETR